ncbi:hypothetical protein [Beijerinckia indica]|nr:hypothetical protein [Beijerinckia indica]
MLETLVIVKALGGKPQKRIFLSIEDQQALVADPALLEEILLGIHQPIQVPSKTVFHYDEPVFEALCQEWHKAKQTDDAQWNKLAPFDIEADPAEW